MKPFNKLKISKILMCFALCLSAGLCLLKKPTTAKADMSEITDFSVTAGISTLYNSIEDRPFPAVNVTVNLGSFAQLLNEGCVVEREDPAMLRNGYEHIEEYALLVGLSNEPIDTSNFTSETLESLINRDSIYRTTTSNRNYIGYSAIYQTYIDTSKSGQLAALSSPCLSKLRAPSTTVYIDLVDVYSQIGVEANWESLIDDDFFLYVIPYRLTTHKELETTILGGYKEKNKIFKFDVYDAHIETLNFKENSFEILNSQNPGTTLYQYIKNVATWANVPTKPEGEKIPVQFKYRKMTDVNTYEDVIIDMPIDWNLTFSANAVYAEIPRYVKGANSYSYFNASYKDTDILDDEIVLLNSERTIYQAIGYSYNFDATTQTGIVSVDYTDFFAKDFCIELVSNDPSDSSSIFIYSTDIKTNNNITTITFDYARICEQLLNQRDWLVDLQTADFDIKQSGQSVDIITNDNELKIIVEDQNTLSNVSVKAIAEIVEDVDVEVEFELILLEEISGGEFQKTIISEKGDFTYSTYLRFNEDSIYAFMGEGIDDFLSCDLLVNCDYMSYAGIKRVVIEEMKKYKIIIQYNYNMIFKVVQANGDILYLPVDKHQSEYSLDDLNVNIPEGERIENIIVSDNLDLTINASNIKDSKIEIAANTYSDEIGVVQILTTDEFYVNVNYLEQYSDTPFAYAKSKNGSAKVSDIPLNGESPTSFLQSFLAKDSLVCLKSNIESVEMTFNGLDTYTFNLKYTFTSLKKINYNGDVENEVIVPLTRFADWSIANEKNWSILYLNMPGTMYFEYSTIELPDGTILSEENLYGYFATAVFEEQAKDLNFYFKGFSGDGVVSLFESTEASGGRIYKSVANIVNNSENFIIDAFTYPILAFCEITNDDNKLYHSYFFYLDCKVDTNQAFISNGRADSVDDTDGAMGNATQDAIDKVGDVAVNAIDDIKDLFTKDEGGLSWFAWLLIGVSGLALILLAIYLFIRK